MIHTLVAHFHAPDIYSIDPDFFGSLGIQTVMADLDNTLEGYALRKPSARAYVLKDELRERGISLVLYSDRQSKAVSAYAKTLGVKLLSDCRLPKIRTIAKFLEINEIAPADVIFVGASVTRDSKMALKIGSQMILTDPLPEKKDLRFRFRSLTESRKRRKAHKLGIDGRETPLKNKEVN